MADRASETRVPLRTTSDHRRACRRQTAPSPREATAAIEGATSIEDRLHAYARSFRACSKSTVGQTLSRFCNRPKAEARSSAIALARSGSGRHLGRHACNGTGAEARRTPGSPGPLTAGIVPQQQRQPGSIQSPRLLFHASCSSPGGLGEAAALVLATQEFLANGGGGRQIRAARLLHRRGGPAASAVSVSVAVGVP
jgi:hypothetical protein